MNRLFNTFISRCLSRYKSLAPILLFALAVPMAHAQGLTKATGFLDSISSQLKVWIPVIAVISGLALVIAYWFNMIQKDTFIRWLVGLIIAGSVTEIVALFV